MAGQFARTALIRVKGDAAASGNPRFGASPSTHTLAADPQATNAFDTPVKVVPVTLVLETR